MPLPPAAALAHSRRLPPLLRLKRLLPRSLFGRTLLIFVVPTFILLASATYVFFDRHWYTVEQRMTHALAGDTAFVIELLQKSTDADSTAGVLDLALEKMDLTVSFAPGRSLPDNHGVRGPISTMLKHALNESLSDPFVLDMTYAPETIRIMVGVPEGVYTVLSPERRVYTPTTQVFILWMTGSSILLTTVVLFFMRNQIRPIRRLADAAEAIGKGREVPNFKLEGASEVRQAAAALMVMRDRLQRQIGQRTAMLAGVSHDLRTPLTRMRLQIEMMGNSRAAREMLLDVAEMQDMLDGYLAFARGEEAEPALPTDLTALLVEMVEAARRQHPDIDLHAEDGITIILRRNAIKRCLSNLIGNAVRYGSMAAVQAAVQGHDVIITVDDDGPGIPPDRREDMFRPFTRMEESRNASTGGVGLGLSIARDIARAHGGDIFLEDSPLGGLRARLWLPV